MTKLMHHRGEAFFALPFVYVEDDVVAGRAVPCVSAGAAVSCAQRFVHHYGVVGALALKSNPRGDSLDVLRAFGDVPAGQQINLAASSGVAAANERSRRR